MAVSGTVATTTIDTQKVIDHAFRRCKLRAEQVAGEWQTTARDLLYFFLTALGNQGVPLWCLEYQIIALYEGQAAMPLPVGTVDVRVANERRLTRLTGTYTSSGGGTVGNAFDNDFATKLIQTQTSAQVLIDFGSSTQVTTAGFLPGANFSAAVAWQRSADQSAWTDVLYVSAASYSDNVWAWWDMDPAVANQYFRLNVSGGSVLNAREIFVGNNPTEIPLSRQNIDQYWALTNKTNPGQPLQYFFDRVLSPTAQDEPVMYIWPVTNAGARYDQLTIRRHRQIMDVGRLTSQLEFPPRWMQAVIWGLAKAIAEEHPDVDVDRQSVCKIEYTEALREAQAEERDDSPTYFGVNLAPYSS